MQFLPVYILNQEGMLKGPFSASWENVQSMWCCVSSPLPAGSCPFWWGRYLISVLIPVSLMAEHIPSMYILAMYTLRTCSVNVPIYSLDFVHWCLTLYMLWILTSSGTTDTDFSLSCLFTLWFPLLGGTLWLHSIPFLRTLSFLGSWDPIQKVIVHVVPWNPATPGVSSSSFRVLHGGLCSVSRGFSLLLFYRQRACCLEPPPCWRWFLSFILKHLCWKSGVSSCPGWDWLLCSVELRPCHCPRSV